MRACFLKDNICALGYGVAIVQTPKAENDEAAAPERVQQQAAVPMDVPEFDGQPDPRKFQ